ncbi:MAG: carboxymuconolactone decarboxylase family protein, partial [Rhodospirillaceae bacterium]|nr:carboxymuconolactone decarboxylase family protein [Rhodospirillaceae bacterium]
LEMHHWPELRQSVNDLLRLVFPGRGIDGELKQLIFTAASLASGCLHCQSHGSYHLHKLGVSDERIQALWSYQTSPEFSDAERAALDLAFAAGVSPNAVEPENYVELRKHYSNDQIIEESIDFAERVLRPVGWNSGKHTGAAEEQRKGHPITLGYIDR